MRLTELFYCLNAVHFEIGFERLEQLGAQRRLTGFGLFRFHRFLDAKRLPVSLGIMCEVSPAEAGNINRTNINLPRTCPRPNLGQVRATKNTAKSLVGAAGFEPATWSTQNSRATRLRYAPAPCRASIHGSVCASKPRRAAATSLPAAAEDRVPHPVARRDAELLGGAADDCEHRAHRPAGGHERFRERHRVLGDAQDAPVAADEDHVERDIGVLHPEAGRLFLMEVEQHALPFRQLAAEHESFRLLLRR